MSDQSCMPCRRCHRHPWRAQCSRLLLAAEPPAAAVSDDVCTDQLARCFWRADSCTPSRIWRDPDIAGASPSARPSSSTTALAEAFPDAARQLAGTYTTRGRSGSSGALSASASKNSRPDNSISRDQSNISRMGEV